jgi:DNA mismatch endonuclease, patch repair protein
MVSAQMSRMPRASSKPEVAVRRALHARGFRFRLNRRDLPGTPDIVLPRWRLAVFIDGCFWHGCPDHGVLPKNNGEWWKSKLAGNAERDARKDRELRELGWHPVHFWEHEDVERVCDAIQDMTASGERPDSESRSS